MTLAFSRHKILLFLPLLLLSLLITHRIPLLTLGMELGENGWNSHNDLWPDKDELRKWRYGNPILRVRFKYFSQTSPSILMEAKGSSLPNWEPMYSELGSFRSQRSYRSERESSKAQNSQSSQSSRDSGINSRSSPSSTDRSEAVFVTENTTVVTAQIGSTASLPCIVRNLGSGVASWIRRHDYHLLTVGMGTYSNDDRFFVSHNRPNQNWELHIKFVKPSDAGTYECQISTHPPSSVFIELRVVEAKAEILGQYDKHVRSGSNFELVCVLRNSTEPPVYVFWFHNDRMINYDNERGVVVSSDIEKSILSIQEAQKSDSGNYTCSPSNASPSWIVVHILNGEKPAAMQHGSHNGHSPTHRPSQPPLFLFLSLLSLLLTSWLTRVSSANYATRSPPPATSPPPSSASLRADQPQPQPGSTHYYYLQEWKDRKESRVVKSTPSTEPPPHPPHHSPLGQHPTSAPHLQPLLKDSLQYMNGPFSSTTSHNHYYHTYNEFQFKLLHLSPSPPSRPASSPVLGLETTLNSIHLLSQFLQSPTQSLSQFPIIPSSHSPSSQSLAHSSNFRKTLTFPTSPLPSASSPPPPYTPLPLQAR